MGTGYLGPDVDARCHRCGGTGNCAETTSIVDADRPAMDAG